MKVRGLLFTDHQV